ncbi:hypothetical protein DIPPA_07970 [Diplonema papillatum]|nr:hypothetical protein DIPPA_07970 [Diplonema papillatum]
MDLPTDAQKATAEALVGKTWESDVTQDDVDAIVSSNRILVGKAPMTRDFRPWRLNLFVNENTKEIEKVSWV